MREELMVKEIFGLEIDFNDIKIRTAYALNLCTVSVSQIIDYNDLIVLEQEYETILNNLNIEMMPKDESLLKILKQLLDTITFFRIQEVDKKFIERDYQNKMKNAIWSAIPNIGVIFGGGDRKALAFTLASQIGIGYMNYRKNKAYIEDERERNQWRLQRAAIEQFNGLRRELFDTAWRLVDAYDLPDEYRLTEYQVKQYNEILMDADIYRRFERLNTIKKYFIAYPQFWYFFGNTANELARQVNSVDADYYLNIAKACYEVFIREFRTCKLLRENQVASACALEYIDMLDGSIPGTKEKIEELIEFAEEMSGGANDVLQLCAFSYLKIGKQDKAAVLLRRLVNESYNKIVNAQLLSGYYVSLYISGNTSVERDYRYLKERINEKYLFPLMQKDVIEKSGDEAEESITSNFLQKQKEILTDKFGLVIDLFRKKYLCMFNRCIPVPTNKSYTDEYYDESLDSFAARKMDGIVLKNKVGLLKYVSQLQECDYPYNYLLVLNDMLNTIFTLDCIQGGENDFLKCLSDAVVEKRNILKSFRDKIEGESEFTAETYNQMIEVSFDDFTRDFFEKLLTYSSAYIAMKKDIISMNYAENNLRDFCVKQGFSSPEELFENADNIKIIPEIKKQYLGIELIDDGVLTSEVNSHFREIFDKVSVYAKNICSDESCCQCILSGEEEFERYFIRLGESNHREIRRKTVAIIDDSTAKDNDILFTTEGITQIIKGKLKENIPYDKIKINNEKSSIILRQKYYNPNINMDILIKIIGTLRSKKYMEIKRTKGTSELRKALNEKMQDVFFF